MRLAEKDTQNISDRHQNKEAVTCSRRLPYLSRTCRREKSVCWWHAQSARSTACVWPVGKEQQLRSWCRGCSAASEAGLKQAVQIIKQPLTNFSVHGKSNSFTRPKSSPVTIFRPAWVTQAQLTSALSAFRGQIPMTSSPRMLFQIQVKKEH